MFREFVILLCAGTFVSGISVHSADKNVPVQSQAPASEAAQQQDNLALPSQVSYQNIAAPSNKNVLYQVNPAVVDTISEATPAKSVPGQSYGSSKVQQKTVTVSASVASDPSSPEYKNILERYTPVVEPINPYFGASIAARTVTIGSNEAVNAGQVGQASHGDVTKPSVVYTNHAAQSGPYYLVPYAQTAVESQKTVNVHPPPSQGTQYGPFAIGYTTNSAPRPFYPANTAIIESHEALSAHSPAVASYQVNQALNTLPPQYLPARNPAVNAYSVSAVPIAPKKETIEAYNSVITHPPPAPKFVHAPIPVPVIYQAVETHHPANPQFAVLSKTAPTAGSYIQVPVGVDPLTLPVYSRIGARLQYHPIPVTGGHQHGYAKAVVFSPASEVSRVTFNGLGVSYGW